MIDLLGGGLEYRDIAGPGILNFFDPELDHRSTESERISMKSVKYGVRFPRGEWSYLSCHNILAVTWEMKHR